MSSKTMFKLCCIVLIVTLLFESSLGQTCVIDGVDEADWASSKNVNFEDAARDEVFSASTTNVAGISSYSQTGNLNFKSDYITPSYQGGVFTLTLTDAFADYEKQETLREFNLVVVFSCASQSRTLTIICRITDRNTYPPEFLPSNSYQYEIFTPMPPGVPISKLYGPISVVDYDLTTSSIDFTIEPNDYLEIVYDSVDSSKKIHTAILMTKSAILTIEGQRNIKIFATDKDDTNDPPFTSEATITLTSNPVAQLPSAPQFSKPYFTGTIKDGLLTIDDQIEITSGYDDEIQFSLSDDKYFQVANTEKVVTITLKAPIPDEILENTDHFLFSVHAALQNTAGGSATVYVSIPKDGVQRKVLKFEQANYKGNYLDNDKLELPVIKLTEMFDVVKYVLTGDFSDNFEITSQDSTVIFAVKAPLSAETLNTYTHIVLVVEAQVTDALSGQTSIVIDLPIKEEGVQRKILKFKQANYKGNYLDNDILDLPVIELTEVFDVVKYVLTGDFSDNFEITSQSSTVTFEVKNPLSDETLDTFTHIVLVVEAQVTDAASGQTSIVIDLPIRDGTGVILQFEDPYYEVQYKDNHEIDVPAIKLTKEYDSVDFTLSGEFKDHFSVTSTGESTAVLAVIIHLPAEVLEEKSFLVLVLEASLTEAVGAKATINIALPIKDITIAVSFDETFYSGLYAYSTNTLTIPAITLVEGYNDNTDFSLSGENSELFETDSDGNTVTLKIKRNLPESLLDVTSVLLFSIQAVRPGAPLATAVIAISLRAKAGIPGNALTIIDILEQKSYQNMNIGDIEDNCKYVKKSTWPESTPDWFEVDSTGKFLNIKEISREDPSVAFLYLSQAQLELSIDCSTSIRRNATKENDDADDAERYWISTKSINYSPDKRMVTVIIRDINNNPPVFDTANPLIIGFPIQDIAYVIRPQALYTVHATDKDIGINAEIKYTTDNDYFSVHPETGVIYPKHDLYTENALTETINFKVSATDGEDESGSTHTVDLNIMVKPLKQSDISIITIEDAVIEDIPEIISTLSDKLNSKVHMLTSAVLPSTNHLRSQNNNHMDKFLRSKRDFSGEDTSLAMFIYALDNQNEIISGSELVSKIEGIVDVGNLDWTVTGIPLSESSLMGGLGKTSSNTGLIAATAVLGSLLFITLVGIVVFYFLVVRKKYRTFSNSHSSGSDVSSIQSEEDKKSNLDYVDEVGTSQLDNLTMGDVIIPGFARELDNENQGQIKGTNSSDVDEDEYGEPSSKGRRKSMVTFNEKVLQIDIDPSYEDERL